MCIRDSRQVSENIPARKTVAKAALHSRFLFQKAADLQCGIPKQIHRLCGGIERRKSDQEMCIRDSFKRPRP